LCLLKALKVSLKKICVGTTSYVKNDKSSDISYLVKCICDTVPILSIDLGLEYSKKEGLKSYKSGIAKEGVGAGGASIAATLKLGSKWTSSALLRIIEKEYENSIEKNRIRS
jgi:NaMN:DMB phosphoribosyltransferase